MAIKMEPVGDGHHDVQGSQEEDRMEVGVAVDGSFSLIIRHVLASTSVVLLTVICVISKTETAASSLNLWLTVPTHSECCRASPGGGRQAGVKDAAKKDNGSKTGHNLLVALSVRVEGKHTNRGVHTIFFHSFFWFAGEG